MSRCHSSLTGTALRRSTRTQAIHCLVRLYILRIFSHTHLEIMRDAAVPLVRHGNSGEDVIGVTKLCEGSWGRRAGARAGCEAGRAKGALNLVLSNTLPPTRTVSASSMPVLRTLGAHPRGYLRPTDND